MLISRKKLLMQRMSKKVLVSKRIGNSELKCRGYVGVGIEVYAEVGEEKK